MSNARPSEIETTFSRSSAGSLLSAGDLDHAVLAGTEGAKPLSLYLNGENASVAVLVSLVVRRTGRGGCEVKRQFHVDTRGTWVSVAGWESVTITYDKGPAGIAVSYAWLTLPVPTSRPLFFWQTVAAPGAIPTPPGARAVVPAVADAAATWTQSDGGAFVVPAPLVAGASLPVSGSTLTLTVAPQTLVWELEPV